MSGEAAEKRKSWRIQASRWLLSVLFVFAGVMHFVRPEFFVRIVPPVLPYPLELVWISGFFEVLLGAMVHFKRTRKLSRGGLTLLLLAVFPANIYMAINSHLFRFLPSAVLWGRLPLQIALMGWVWLATRESD